MTLISALIAESKLSGGKVKISNLNSDAVEAIDIKASLSGELADLTAVYEGLELGGDKPLFRKRDVTGGVAETIIDIGFPLVDSLAADDVRYDVKSKITTARINNLGGEVSVSRANIDLAVANSGISAKGNLLAHLGLKEEYFTANRIPLGFDVVQNSGKPMLARVTADISQASFAVPEMDISKPANSKASLSLQYNEEGNWLNNIELKSTSLNFSGAVQLNKKMDDFREIKIKKIAFNDSVLTGDIKKTDKYLINLAGNYLDVAKFLEEDESKSDEEADIPNLQLSLNLAELGVAGGDRFKDVQIVALCGGDDCSQISFGSSAGSLYKIPTQLKLESQNAGRLLKGLGAYDEMIGGVMQVEATGQNSEYTGYLLIEDFKIKGGGFLGKILTLGSLTGIADILQGEGISFKKLKTNFRTEGDKTYLTKFRAKGSAIGATAEGWFDTEEDGIRLEGNVIPAYSANTALGEIPVLGGLVVGDDGVFAIKYTVKGKLSDPSVHANPLSALAPGILKDVFK